MRDVFSVFLGLDDTAGNVKTLTDILSNFNNISIMSVIRRFNPIYQQCNYSNITVLINKYGKTNIFEKLLILIKEIPIFIKSLLKCDFFIFLSSGSFLIHPFQIDLVLLKIFKKKILMLYTGNDIRLYSYEQEKNPYFNLMISNEKVRKKYLKLDKAHRRKLKWQSKFIDLCSCSENLYPQVRQFFHESKIMKFIPVRAVDTSSIKPKYPLVSPDRKIRILHLPSNRVKKGTKYVISAIETLKSRGYNFEFILPEKRVSNKQALKLIESSDIIVDQLLLGNFGKLAVESMAYGKVVVVYIRDDVRENMKLFHDEEPPLINANVDNLSYVLKSLINRSENELKEIGVKGRNFVEKYYSFESIGKKLVEELEKLRSS